MSGACLVLLHDVDQHQFIEHGMRGRLFMVTHCHGRANNAKLSEYDPTNMTEPTTPNSQSMTPPTLQPSSNTWTQTTYMVGQCVSRCQSQASSREKELTASLQARVLTQPDDAPMGFIVQCDISVPPDLHRLFQDYPLALEKI